MQAFPGLGGKQQISSDGGIDPLWAQSGRELFYRQGDLGEKVLAVDVETQVAFHASKPRLLFEGRYSLGADTPDWAVSRDGRRFLFIKPSEREETQRHVNVSLGWFRELQRLVVNSQ